MVFPHWEMVLENGIKVLRIVSFSFVLWICLSDFFLQFLYGNWVLVLFSSKIYNLQTAGMLQYKINCHFRSLFFADGGFFPAIFRLTLLYRVTVINMYI